MRVTKRSNIAIRVLMFCAANPGRLVTKHEIAEVCNVSENHLAQVIHQLALEGYLSTQRGRKGGLKLARAAEDISIGKIFRTIETGVPLVECFADTDNSCPLVEACLLKDALQEAAAAFYAHLDAVTLDTLVCHNTALLSILAPDACKAPQIAAIQ